MGHMYFSKTKWHGPNNSDDAGQELLATLEQNEWKSYANIPQTSPKKKDYWLLMCYVYKIPNRMQRLNREVRISGCQAMEYANPK